MNLAQAKVGSKHKVIGINAQGKIKFRLSSVGINVGDEIVVKQFAPLGDPIVLQTDDFVLALRKADAKQIEVE